MGRDRHPDGVRVDPATPADLATYAEASAQIDRMQAPLLHRASDPNSRLFVMALDGTGNDMEAQPRENWTNVALLREQVDALASPNVRAGYVAGPGTQDGTLAALVDGITGRTFESRIEEGYDKFIVQAKTWLAENPGADISVAAVGFSRGAEQAAAFTRLVHERGIQDPDSAVYERNSAGMITGVTYTRPPLVAPGEVKQAAMLFDPVGTGAPMDHDRRLAPTVMGGLQISALHEQRDQFPSTESIESGLSADRRFLQVWVAGAHSNIGGSYAANGLSDRSFNLAADYLNGLSDPPLFTKRPESLDPGLNVIHRSYEHQIVYTQRGYRDGVRDVVDRLAPEEACRPEPRACFEREPIDPRMAAATTWREVQVTPNPQAPLPGAQAPSPETRPFWQRGEAPAKPANPVDDLFDRLSIGAATRDPAAMREASRNYVESGSGQQWLQAGREFNATQAAEQAAERARQAEAQRATVVEAPEPSAPVMRR
ncbi:MAG: phospholipase effector Tle1 domain-containing protein [Silanimonas sp.]